MNLLACVQCYGSGIRDPMPFLASGSGLGFLGSWIPLRNPYFWELSDNFLGKMYYNSLSVGSNFFLYLFKNKIIDKTRILLLLYLGSEFWFRYQGSRMDKNQDPECLSWIRNTACVCLLEIACLLLLACFCLLASFGTTLTCLFCLLFCLIAFVCLHLHAFACVCLRLLACACVCLRVFAFVCVCLRLFAFVSVCLRLLATACNCFHLLAYTCLLMLAGLRPCFSLRPFLSLRPCTRMHSWASLYLALILSLGI